MVALSLQLQLFLVDGGELSAPGLPLAQKSLHLGVLLHHLLGNLLVLGLELLHHSLTARSVPRQVLLQLLQLGQVHLHGVLLALEPGQFGPHRGHVLAAFLQLLL